MKVTIHQPDLLPYTGFWFKMATVDRFVLAVHDQFQKHGYQRRVSMRGSWCSHRLSGKPALVPINTVRVVAGWQDRLVDVIRGRYRTAPYWRLRGSTLCDGILECPGERLDEVNRGMIELIRGMLAIDTEIVCTSPPTRSGRERLIEQVLAVGGTEYLSGAGGAAYLGDDADQRFSEAGIRLAWSAHRALTPDSIVTVLMDYSDPMDAVLSSTKTDDH